MNRIAWIAVVWTVVATTSDALGHGLHPLVVRQQNNQLIVSGGVTGNADGFVNDIHYETGSAGDPQDLLEEPGFGFGQGAYWILPSFDIAGLDENSGLYLQPIARPVRGTNPVESRVLWYWNPNSAADDKVELAPSDSKMLLRHSPSVGITLTPTTFQAPPQIKIAEPLNTDMHPHNEDLMKYLLPYPFPNDGAYAFFARLTSDLYAPSDPLLVVINNGGLEGIDMLDAAAAINRDALLAGDYNHDDRVDAKDYAVWRKTLGSTTALAADGSGNQHVDQDDFDVWRHNFGATVVGSGLAIAEVPEPNGRVLAVVGVVVYLLALSMRALNGTHVSSRRA
jgi:hypothetical protein